MTNNPPRGAQVNTATFNGERALAWLGTAVRLVKQSTGDPLPLPVKVVYVKFVQPGTQGARELLRKEKRALGASGTLRSYARAAGTPLVEASFG